MDNGLVPSNFEGLLALTGLEDSTATTASTEVEGEGAWGHSFDGAGGWGEEPAAKRMKTGDA